MLPHCIKADKCLILESISLLNRQPHRQLPLLPEKGFFGVSPIIDELLLAKKNGNRTSRYVSSLRHYLTQFFQGRENSAISDFTTQVIEQWLARYKSPNTRRTWLSRLSAFFSFAVRRDYIEKNPCDKIERVTMDRKPPKILTVAESRLLLKSCATVMKPYLILGMFAGIRPEEVMRLDWSQINLETKTVRVEGKTRRRRIVTLEPLAVALLREHPIQRSAVTPSQATITRWKKKARKILGLDRFPQDLLRHTAASYLIALHGDAGKVALSLGNSTKILLTHYHEPVTAENCAAFWSPDGMTKSYQGGLATTGATARALPDGQTVGAHQPQGHTRHETPRDGLGATRTAQREQTGDHRA